jgi:diacylglycerol kinase (ATP)
MTSAASSPSSSSPTAATLWLNHPVLRPSKVERNNASSSSSSSENNNNNKSPTTKRKVGNINNNNNGLQNILVVLHGVKIKSKRGKKELETLRRLREKYSIAGATERATKCEGDCREIVRECVLKGEEAPPDAIFVLGGDGTLREAVQGYVEARKEKPLRENEKHVPIVALPCGTGNNFARDLKCFTVEDCFRLACESGEARDADAVQIESYVDDDIDDGGASGDDIKKKKKKKKQMTMSINVVTWGMARDAAETAEKMRFLGPIRYDLAGFYHILKNKSNVASLTAETPSSRLKGSCADEDFLMLFAQNTRCSGRGFHFTPMAKLDDGLMDVVVAKKCGTLKTVALFDDTKAPKNGAHVEKDDVFYIQCEKLKIDTGDREELVGVDGEVTLKTPVELELKKGAWSTFFPR